MFKDTIVITNRKLVKGDYLEQIRKVVSLHPYGLILREKDLTDQDYEALSIEVLKICEAGQVPCFLHSRAELAKKLACKNIHLSLASLLEQQGSLGAFEQISVSCHSLEDVKTALEHGATQIVLGTIFETECKKGLKGRGLSFVKEITDYCRSHGDIPVFAIGGITPENIGLVKDAGARGGCMMSYMMTCLALEEDKMISFASDYIAGAHPFVLQRLVDTNLECLSGYGSDRYCLRAAEKIKKACECKDADVFFLVGGTQTNQIIISTMLDSHEGVIAATSGHVSSHEAGAIEFLGHKVIQVPEKNGKLDASSIKGVLESFYKDENHEHMVFPGMVYLSFPTEYGTIYSKSELTQIYEVCKEYQIPLFMDGARLGYGLSCEECDITLADLPKLCDVFYIGGTKVGALCGEAVVFTHKNAPKHFVTKIKQRGALLAKGRVLGVQFDALFTEDLYMKISKHAIEMAKRLKALFMEKGYRFYIDSPTNQQFIILENEKMKALQKEVSFSFWENYDEHHTVVRFATSWSTTEEDLEELGRILDGVGDFVEE